MVAGSEAYAGALMFYHSVKGAAGLTSLVHKLFMMI
jgi:hypothetical protein